MPNKIPKEENNQILDEQLNIGVTLVPRWLRKFYTSSLVQRSLSYLMGWDYITGHPVKLACNADGSVRTTTIGTSNTRNETIWGTSTDVLTTIGGFSQLVNVVDIFVFDNDVKLKHSVDGVTYDDYFTLTAGTFYSISVSTADFQIISRYAGQVSIIQFIGWY